MTTAKKEIKVFSMLSNDQAFPIYEVKKKTGGVSVNKAKGSILIKGGANVANKHFQTKPFIETTVSADDFKLLQESPVFKRMVDRGFITTEKPTALKKDKSAPITKKEAAAKAPGVEVKTNELKPS